MQRKCDSCAYAFLVLAAAAPIGWGQQPPSVRTADKVVDSPLGAGRPSRLDPTSIPKYVIPLVIPPVMKDDGTADSYDIAVREFKQQILPGGIWNTLNGRADDFPPSIAQIEQDPPR